MVSQRAYAALPSQAAEPADEPVPILPSQEDRSRSPQSISNSDHDEEEPQETASTHGRSSPTHIGKCFTDLQF